MFQLARLSLACLAGALAAAPAGAATNLIKNGGFESPLVPAAWYTDFTTGDPLGEWTVVSGNAQPGDDRRKVSVVSTTFTQMGIGFPALEGIQWLDLTGLSVNTYNGVQQTVVTQPGKRYALTFYVGNVVDVPGGLFGQTSSVEVLINGAHWLTAVNRNQDHDPSGANRMAWQKFVTVFTASQPTTTVTFMNLDATGDNVNGLDNVSLALDRLVPPPAQTTAQ